MRFIGFLIGFGTLVAAMLLLRAALRRRIPPGVLYALWLIPAVRLLFPFALFPVPVLPENGGMFSAFYVDGREENAEPENTGNSDTALAVQNTQGGETAGSVPQKGGGKIPEDVQKESERHAVSNRRKTGLEEWLLWGWLAGSIVCGGYVFRINYRLRQRVKKMRRLPQKSSVPVYVGEEAVPPCLFGLFHPCILLSEQVAGNRELCRQVLLHEETHYRQKDHVWTALRIVLCMIYWWNPLVWLCAACVSEDAEFACDARALRGASLSERKAYGYALLEILQGAKTSRVPVSGVSPVSGRGKNMKRRLENILAGSGKSGLWALPVCLLLILFTCGFGFPAQEAGAGKVTGEEKTTAPETGERDGTEKDRDRAYEAAESRRVDDRTENSPGDDTAEGSPADSAVENSPGDGTAGESGAGIRLRPQGDRPGYREPELHYTASAGWLTDLSDRPEELKRVEELARRALRELYDMTGSQVEQCFYGYNEIGMLCFARSEEDMAHSRVFYSRSLGEEDGYDIISSVDVASARRVWYSDIQQLALPENVSTMTGEELAVWFLEHSPLCSEGVAVGIEAVSENEPDRLKLTMEDGTFYEIKLDMEILAAENIYGPYPADAQH